MNKTLILTTLLAAGIALPAAAQAKKVLVVGTTTGFRHSSIPVAERIIAQLGQESGAYTVDFAKQPENEPRAPKKPADNATQEQKDQFQKDQAAFNDARKAYAEAMKQVLTKLSPANLKNYDAVVFANTTGDLPLPDPQGFLDWIAAGHGFVGMHSATDTFHGFRPYIEMIGGEFQSHGAQAAVDANNEDKGCAACRHLGDKLAVFDEIYLMKSYDKTKVHNLLALDLHPNTKAPGYFPISWNKTYGKGRVFYTSLGHREDVWDPAWKDRKNSPEVAKDYQKHILGGIKWALGLETCEPKTQQK